MSGREAWANDGQTETLLTPTTSSTVAAHFFWIAIGTAQSVIYLYLYRNDGCIACFVISCSHSG